MFGQCWPAQDWLLRKTSRGEDIDLLQLILMIKLPLCVSALCLIAEPPEFPAQDGAQQQD